jgi:aspartokinase
MSREANVKRELPSVTPDGHWEERVLDLVVRMREAKIRERDKAHQEALAQSPADPTIQENAKLYAMIAEQKNQDGSYRPLTYDEIMERGERFLGRLISLYARGLAALAKKESPSSEASSEETGATQKQSDLVRP